MIKSRFGPPFNEDNAEKQSWVARKSAIKFFIESQMMVEDQYAYASFPVLEMMADLWVALEAEESDNEMYAHNLAIIYDEVTGGMISKPNTDVNEVIKIYYERQSEKYEEGYQDGKEEGMNL